jgi:hypothetical protein
MNNPLFTNPVDSYKRDINPIGHYVEQMAIMLSKETNDPIEKCKEWIANKIKNKQFKSMRNPEVNYFERQDNGDRIEKTTTLSNYIRTIEAENLILAPSFTCYLHQDTKPSLLVEFLQRNVKERSIAKKKAFQLKAKGDMNGFTSYNNIQQTKKIYNNSLSGAFASSGTCLFNPSGHYTLTSTTRCVASYGNGNSERMIAGNRHYHSTDIAINNILAVLSTFNYDIIKKLIDKYNLHLPTTDEAFSVVLRASEYYWRNKDVEDFIYNLLDKATPYERAWYVYSGDFYHLRVYNNNLIKKMIERASEKVSGLSNNTVEELYSLDESYINLAHHICLEEVKGKGTDYEEMKSDGTLDLLISTGKHAKEVFEEYRDLIKAFLVTESLPPTIAYLPNMYRKVTVLSDTDSTCATYQEWVKWYFGDIIFNPKATAISATVMTMVTETVAHTLASFSANMNVAKDKMDVLAMKNEFYWDIMTPMNVAKHYFANVRIQEGNVFTKPDLELKGVHLITSNTSKGIIKDAHGQIRKICDTVTDNRKLKLLDYIKHVAAIEKEIIEKVSKGDPDIFKQGKVKEYESYKADNPARSPYVHHMMWEDVFKPKYGIIGEPPYQAIKIPTTLENKTATKKWLDSLEDVVFRNRMEDWLNSLNKTNIGIMLLSRNFVEGNGMPVEIQSCIDTKRIILDICQVYYIILESIGFYRKKDMTLTELGY